MSGSSRFSLSGDFLAIWIPEADAPANLAAVKIATELGHANAIDLIGPKNGEGLVADSINGFTISATTIDVPDYHEVSGTIPGTSSIPQWSMEFYRHRTQSIIWSGLDKGQAGFVVFCFEGATAEVGGEYEIHPSDTQTRQRMKAKNDAHKFTVTGSSGVPTIGTFAA